MEKRGYDHVEEVEVRNLRIGDTKNMEWKSALVVRGFEISTSNLRGHV